MFVYFVNIRSKISALDLGRARKHVPSPTEVGPGTKIVHFGVYSDKNSQFSIE